MYVCVSIERKPGRIYVIVIFCCKFLNFKKKFFFKRNNNNKKKCVLCSKWTFWLFSTNVFGKAYRVPALRQEREKLNKSEFCYDSQGLPRSQLLLKLTKQSQRKITSINVFYLFWILVSPEKSTVTPSSPSAPFLLPPFQACIPGLGVKTKSSHEITVYSHKAVPLGVEENYFHQVTLNIWPITSSVYH